MKTPAIENMCVYCNNNMSERPYFSLPDDPSLSRFATSDEDVFIYNVLIVMKAFYNATRIAPSLGYGRLRNTYLHMIDAPVSISTERLVALHAFVAA